MEGNGWAGRSLRTVSAAVWDQGFQESFLGAPACLGKDAQRIAAFNPSARPSPKLLTLRVSAPVLILSWIKVSFHHH